MEAARLTPESYFYRFPRDLMGMIDDYVGQPLTAFAGRVISHQVISATEYNLQNNLYVSNHDYMVTSDGHFYLFCLRDGTLLAKHKRRDYLGRLTLERHLARYLTKRWIYTFNFLTRQFTKQLCDLRQLIARDSTYYQAVIQGDNLVVTRIHPDKTKSLYWVKNYIDVKLVWTSPGNPLYYIHACLSSRYIFFCDWQDKFRYDLQTEQTTKLRMDFSFNINGWQVFLDGERLAYFSDQARGLEIFHLGQDRLEKIIPINPQDRFGWVIFYWYQNKPRVEHCYRDWTDVFYRDVYE